MNRVVRKLFKVLPVRQRRMAVVLLFLMIIGAVMESLSVSLVLPLITAVMDSQNWNTTWYSQVICRMFGVESQRVYIQVLLLLLIAVFILKDIYIIWEYYIQFSFIAEGRFQMQKTLMNSYIRKPYTFYLSASSGEVIRVISSDTNQVSLLLTSVLTFLTEGIVSGVLGITIFVMSPTLAIGLLIVLLLEIFIIARVIKPVMERLGIQSRAAWATTNKWILQSINGIKSIKVSQTERFFSQMYNQSAGMVVDADRKQQTLNNIPRLMIESITVTAVLGIVFIQIVLGTDLVNIVPQLSAFVVAAVRLLPSMNRISTSINQIPFWEGGLDNIIHAMELDETLRTDFGTNVPAETVGSSRTEQNEVASGQKESPADVGFRRSLFLSDVSFSYPGTDKMILEHADLEILPGQSVGIVGPSGAGKTTTVDILLGLLKPQIGMVLVDGENIEDNMAGWLKKVAYIPQKIFLLDSTIKENVAFGEGTNDIDDERVWEALREAQLESFVRSLPAGPDTMVGEQGIRLSGGQCQRIGIARALYRDPDILFFDEATSSLDNETEVAIMESIENLKGRRTLVIIAHRLTTIENCDRVYRVVNGKIIREDKDQVRTDSEGGNRS